MCSRKQEEEKAVKGIPIFWLTIFKNVDMLSDMVFEADVPILMHLEDIKVEITNKPMVSYFSTSTLRLLITVLLLAE